MEAEQFNFGTKKLYFVRKAGQQGQRRVTDLIFIFIKQNSNLLLYFIYNDRLRCFQTETKDATAVVMKVQILAY